MELAREFILVPADLHRLSDQAVCPNHVSAHSEDPGLEVVHPRAGGIDVGNGAHYVAVGPDQDREPVRRTVSSGGAST